MMRARIKTLQNMIARAAVAAAPPSPSQLLAMLAEIGGILDGLVRHGDAVTGQAPPSRGTSHCAPAPTRAVDEGAARG